MSALRRMFDFNKDGEMDVFEKVMEYNFLMDLCREEEELSELELAGLDPEELEFMDSDERRVVLEDAGLDPDDYDF